MTMFTSHLQLYLVNYIRIIIILLIVTYIRQYLTRQNLKLFQTLSSFSENSSILRLPRRSCSAPTRALIFVDRISNAHSHCICFSLHNILYYKGINHPLAILQLSPPYPPASEKQLSRTLCAKTVKSYTSSHRWLFCTPHSAWATCQVNIRSCPAHSRTEISRRV